MRRVYKIKALFLFLFVVSIILPVKTSSTEAVYADGLSPVISFGGTAAEDPERYNISFAGNDDSTSEEVQTLIASSPREVQDLAFFAEDESSISFEDLKLNNYGGWVRKFSGTASGYKIVRDYVDLLSSGKYNFTMHVENEDGEYGDDSILYQATFDYIGDQPINDTVSTTSDWVKDGQIWIFASVIDGKLSGSVVLVSGLGFRDFGLRAGGKVKRVEAGDQPSETDVDSDQKTGTDAAGSADIAVSPREVQDPFDFGEDESTISFGKMEKNNYGGWERKFSGTAAGFQVIRDYAGILSSGKYNFKLHAEYEDGDDPKLYDATFDYIGDQPINETVSMTKGALEKVGEGQISIFASVIDGKLSGSITLVRGLVFHDYGLRAGGRIKEKKHAGELSDSTLETEYMDDGTVVYTTGSGNDKELFCMVWETGSCSLLLDGQTTIVRHRMEYDSEYGRYEIMIDKAYDDEADCFAFTIPEEDMREGAELDLTQYGRNSTVVENGFVHSNEDLLYWEQECPASFGVRHGGVFMYAQRDHTNGIQDVYVKVHAVNEEKGYAVIYFAAEFNSAPFVAEGLACLPLDRETASDRKISKTIELSEGMQSYLVFDAQEYTTDNEVFSWEILEGDDVIRLTAKNQQTCMVYAKTSGTARVRCTYSYSRTEPDVLTGINRLTSHTKTRDYEIVIK